MAAAACRKHGIHADSRVRVIATIGYRPGRADPNNATPTLKAIIDGMTDAGVWPDDSSEYVLGPDPRRDPIPPPTGYHTVTIALQETP
ncbi:RusA family crossover junction endodeoxyribonuclease [Acidipropionibacterium timonense]|uniref:hypothetical protein n=1 Tax=Acidipropionibacterium timonense TaxID=2161818 RepID=UPI00102FB2FF|nr:hypothetical protein [Acidipropionibacterium timonense]